MTEQKKLDTDLLSLRPMTDKDLSFLEKLYASTRWEEMQASGWSDKQIREFLAFQFQAQHKHYQEHYADSSFDVILYGEAKAGRLYLQERDKEFRIVDIALLPKYRGGGLGAHLLREILAKGKAANKLVRIHVEQNNPAMTLYIRLGFKRIEDVGVYDLMEWHP